MKGETVAIIVIAWLCVWPFAAWLLFDPPLEKPEYNYGYQPSDEPMTHSPEGAALAALLWPLWLGVWLLWLPVKLVAAALTLKDLGRRM